MSAMSPPPKTKPISDSVPKINDEIAVGEDLEFQQRWWKFERAIWWLFGVLVILDVLGCFGRGPVANAKLQTPDGSMDIKYERIERLGTPSMMTIQFGGSAIRDGKVELLVSESLVEELGTQRVIPQPAMSKVGNGKILYSFPASTYPATVQLGLAPTRAGMCHLSLEVPGFNRVNTNIFVMP